MKSAPSLQFEWRRSRIEQRLLWTITVVATLAIWGSASPLGGRIAGTLAVCAVWAWQLRQARADIVHCMLLPDGRWQIGAAQAFGPTELVDVRDLGVLIALQFKAPSANRFELVLWPDSVSAEARRKLRIWLNRAPRATTAGY